MLAFFKKLFLAFLLGVLVLLAYQNLQPLSQKMQFEINLYAEGLRYETPELPVVFLFLLFFILGMITTGFHGIYERMARRVEIRKRDKRIRALEKELGQLRVQVAELRPAGSESASGEQGGVVPEGEGREDAGEERPRSLPKAASPSSPSGREEEPTL